MWAMYRIELFACLPIFMDNRTGKTLDSPVIYSGGNFVGVVEANKGQGPLIRGCRGY